MIIMTSGMDNGSRAPVPYDDEDNDIVQHGGLTPANKLTEACTLGLQRASCKISNCIITVGFMIFTCATEICSLTKLIYLNRGIYHVWTSLLVIIHG